MSSYQRFPERVRAEKLRSAIEWIRTMRPLGHASDNAKDFELTTEDGDVVSRIDGDHFLIVLKA